MFKFKMFHKVSITAVFFICWSPLVLYTILYEFLPEIFPQRTVLASVGYTLSLLIGMLTPIANPVFYGILNDAFKEVVHKKFPWLFSTTMEGTIVNLPRNSSVVSQPCVPMLTIPELIKMENGFTLKEVPEEEYPMSSEISSMNEQLSWVSFTKIDDNITELDRNTDETKKPFLETAV